MSSIVHRLFIPIGIGVILTTFLGGDVVAQTKNAPPANMPPNAEDNHGGWSNEVYQHQEFREEMAQVRKEHEELEADRDKLLDKCVNVSGGKVDECNRERQEIRERAARLHDRTHALHERMRAADREAHPDFGPQPKPPGQ